MHTRQIGIMMAAFITSGVAVAGQERVHFDIQQGTGSGFGFSVLHNATNASGAGNILFRQLGTMEMVFDDIAQTFTFSEFDADLFAENNLDPNTLGSRVGSLSLVEGQLLVGANNMLFGSLTLNVTIDGVGDGEATFNFLPIAYNALANRWDPNLNRIGLWGAVANVFGEGPLVEIGNTGLFNLGFDMLTGPGMQVIPLPSGVALGSAGLLGLMGVRRRRTC